MTKKLTYRYVKEEIEKIGYTLLSKKYKNCETKLEIMCNNKHRYLTSWHNFNSGKRCKKCWYVGLGDRQRFNIKNVDKILNKEGYLLLSNYIKNNEKIILLCPNKHIWVTQFNTFYIQQSKCAICYKEKRKRKAKTFKGYNTKVKYLSNQNFNKYYYLINPFNYKRGNIYHLDHIYSIIDGFNNKVSIETISNPVNLRIIKANKNLKKNYKSEISLEMLYKLEKEFNKNEEVNYNQTR